MSMLIAAVAIGGLLRRVLRHLLGVQTRHCDVCKSKRRAQILQLCTANAPGWGCLLQGHFMPTNPCDPPSHAKSMYIPKGQVASSSRHIGRIRLVEVMLPCPDIPKAPRDRHAALIARDAC
jgi:hypothetical protein